MNLSSLTMALSWILGAGPIRTYPMTDAAKHEAVRICQSHTTIGNRIEIILYGVK
jgi:hypothetical protein